VLRDIGGGDGSLVNGEPVHDAVLQPGDQVVFASHHRFVLEAPVRRVASVVAHDDDEDEDERPSADGRFRIDARAGALARSRKLPWLLVAALLLAALLSALLLFGSG
jgi:pSer/pThr/pTyr-binding forkhead associated (FHA) protein